MSYNDTLYIFIRRLFTIKFKFKYLNKSGSLGNTVTNSQCSIYILISDSLLIEDFHSGIRKPQSGMKWEKKGELVWGSNFVT